jgi:hypothetical protein
MVVVIREYLIYCIYYENEDVSSSVYGVELYVINRKLLDSILKILLVKAGIA